MITIGDTKSYFLEGENQIYNNPRIVYNERQKFCERIKTFHKYLMLTMCWTLGNTTEDKTKTYTRAYYSAMRKEKILLSATRIELEGTVLREKKSDR